MKYLLMQLWKNMMSTITCLKSRQLIQTSIRYCMLHLSLGCKLDHTHLTVELVPTCECTGLVSLHHLEYTYERATFLHGNPLLASNPRMPLTTLVFRFCNCHCSSVEAW